MSTQDTESLPFPQFEQLVDVKFPFSPKMYSFRCAKGVTAGEFVFVKTWVNPEGISVQVENTRPIDNKFKYSYALKVNND